MKKIPSSIGIHYGHDAAIATISENGIHYEALERTTRVKHALGIDSSRLEEIVTQLNISCMNISSTQEVPIFYDERKFDIKIANANCTSASDWFSSLDASHHYRKYIQWGEEGILSYAGLHIPEISFGWSHPIYAGSGKGYAQLSAVMHTFDFSATFSIPGTTLVKSNNKTYPTLYRQHHFLHAMYAAGSMGKFKPSIIVTGDGGVGPSYGGGGIYFFHPDLGLRPVTPTNGWIGYFYDYIAFRLGLGADGGAGKLMGLSPYGRPIYFDSSFIGTLSEVTHEHSTTINGMVDSWLERIGFSSHQAEWDKNTNAPPKFISDIAASAQLILEINNLRLIDCAVQIAKNVGFDYEYIILSGGCALNCPSNSNIWQKYSKLIIPPAVNDEGLGIASAILGWKDMTGRWPDLDLGLPYLGHSLVKASMDASAAKYEFSIITDGVIERFVDILTSGDLAAIAEGKSEVGPRALGHRSLVADPTSHSAWERVNVAKRRELWRPLAPAVLESHLPYYFDAGPDISKFMLFNFRVLTKELPAVTHFDHSARVQSVSDPTSSIYKVLQVLSSRGYPPVLLNTSLNGPGVPIAEFEEDVFEVAQDLRLKAILSEGSLYVRKN